MSNDDLKDKAEAAAYVAGGAAAGAGVAATVGGMGLAIGGTAVVSNPVENTPFWKKILSWIWRVISFLLWVILILVFLSSLWENFASVLADLINGYNSELQSRTLQEK